jgi:hypothetical protein
MIRCKIQEFQYIFFLCIADVFVGFNRRLVKRRKPDWYLSLSGDFIQRTYVPKPILTTTVASRLESGRGYLRFEVLTAVKSRLWSSGL